MTSGKLMAEASTQTDRALLDALRRFAATIQERFRPPVRGEAEDQLRGPFEQLTQDISAALHRNFRPAGEVRLADRLGRADYAILDGQLLIGHAELKAPGTGVDVRGFRGHNREQWQRFANLPNVLYTDGQSFALYRTGERIGPIVTLSGDAVAQGARAVNDDDVRAIKSVWTTFLSWTPSSPTDARELAKLLAPLCRLLRQQVAEALGNSESSLVRLAQEWRDLLFPGADNERFADAYAQTVTYVLLLARAEGGRVTDLHQAAERLVEHHEMLGRALEVLTDARARAEIETALQALQRQIAAVDPQAVFAGQSDPWLYFYEDFLAEYDPELRRDAGVYYTPVEVVRCQVRLTESLLRGPRLNKPQAFTDPQVLTLDPAAGTGTYLLGIIEQTLGRIRREQGPGAVSGLATQLVNTLHGFEFMVGPYAVAKLRLSRAIASHGGSLPEPGIKVFLTDTLESPHADPAQARYGFLYEPLAREHRKAMEVKNATPVLVCLGNPPYDRHKSVNVIGPERAGGWVRFADPVGETGGTRQRRRGGRGEVTTADTLAARARRAIFDRMIARPAREAGLGTHLKNAYNLYVYFWVWAIWKVFVSDRAPGPGIVTFITGSSYLDGAAFVGLRQTLRRECDDIWIIDLGGEGRGTRQDDNVFAIQTPVAIAVAVRYERATATQRDTAARVHYCRIEGDRAAKLAALDGVHGLGDLTWQECPTEWHAPFRPAGAGSYFDWPLLTDLMPWQHSGAQFKRTWPIAADEETLRSRWRSLLSAADQAGTFKETRDRKISRRYPPLPGQDQGRAIAELERDAPAPPVERYAYRSFDRQWILADNRLGDFIRPDLWRTHSARQVYLTTLLNHPLGQGPALTASADIPDLHHFRGSYGAKEVLPLHCDAAGEAANVMPGLLDVFGEAYGRAVTAEDFAAYVYAVLAQPAFTRRYAQELATRELRVPLTADGDLFERAAALGRRLLWLHTYGERFIDAADGRTPGGISKASTGSDTECVRPVPQDEADYPAAFSYDAGSRTLHVGRGAFAPVAAEVWDFEVSGLKVVRSWLGYRMREPAGRRSSPLDAITTQRWPAAFTTELLQLLWVLDATVRGYGEQAAVLDAILGAGLIPAADLPAVPDAARRPPQGESAQLFS